MQMKAVVGSKGLEAAGKVSLSVPCWKEPPEGGGKGERADVRNAGVAGLGGGGRRGAVRGVQG